MQPHEFDIAIIEGGCIGSSILYELCQRGIKNIVLVDNGRKTISATAHSVGMLRVFHENPRHIDLAIKNFILLKAYQQSNVLREKNESNGSLYSFNKKRYRAYKKNLLQIYQSDYPWEILTAVTGKSRFPSYVWNDEWAIYEPTGIQLSAEKFMDDLLIASAGHGAKIIENFEINRISSNRNQYQLIGENNLIISKTLVLAGGTRLLPKLSDLGSKFALDVKQIRTYLAKKVDADFRLPNYFDRESLQFGCFIHKDKVILSEMRCARIKERTWGKIIKEKLANDIYAPNRIGLLGKIPSFTNLFIATGWGGTSFKFALEIARRTVDAIEISAKRRTL